jgi:hypothetical protein
MISCALPSRSRQTRFGGHVVAGVPFHVGRGLVDFIIFDDSKHSSVSIDNVLCNSAAKTGAGGVV